MPDYGSENQFISVEFLGWKCESFLADLGVESSTRVRLQHMYIFIYIQEFKVDREYFQHDTFKVNDTFVVKVPHGLTFLLDVRTGLYTECENSCYKIGER